MRSIPASCMALSAAKAKPVQARRSAREESHVGVPLFPQQTYSAKLLATLHFVYVPRRASASYLGTQDFRQDFSANAGGMSILMRG